MRSVVTSGLEPPIGTVAWEGATNRSRPGGAAGVRHAYQASVWMGGASTVNIATGLVRAKVFAVLLGPAGIGVFGALQAFQSLAISVADLGLTGAGVREIAAARLREDTENDVLYVLLRLATLFACVVALAMWICRDLLSSLISGGHEQAQSIGVLSLGVLASAIGGVASAQLMATHRIGMLAWSRIAASVAGMVSGISFVYLFREAGIGWALVSIPVWNSLFAWMGAGRMVIAPRTARAFWSRPEVRTILTFGGSAFGGAVAGMAVQVAARITLMQRYGIEAAGEYQAAWGISMLYGGVILAAVPSDYYPRASALAHDRVALGRAAIDQTRTLIALAAMPLMAAVIFAPTVIQVVYTPEFTQAAEILRWQAVGDPLRIAWWILGTTLLATGSARQFLLLELVWNGCYLGLLLVLPRYFGLQGAGLALPASFIVALPLMIWCVGRVIPRNTVLYLMRTPIHMFGLAAMMAIVVLSDHDWPLLPWIFGTCSLMYAGLQAARVLMQRGSNA